MDLLINVVLPLSLAIIMFSLGLGLRLTDFLRVLTSPKAFALGAISQIILLPVAAYLTIQAFGLSGELAVGVMLLSVCPGGVTSNMITKLGKGDVALSVTLTAVISLLSLLTVPVLAAWSYTHFMGADSGAVSVGELTIAVFLITTVPVLLGAALRQFKAAWALRTEPALSRLAAGLFIVIVIAAVVGNWTTFSENLALLGPALIALNVGLLLVGLALASAFKLPFAQCKTISLEVGVQNATLGIALAGLISGTAEGFGTIALPSAVYGITMYLCALPFVVWFRSR